MSRVLTILLSILRLLQRQHRHAHTSDAEDFRNELLSIKTTVEHIEAETTADHTSQEEQLRIDRKRLWIERLTLGFLILGTFGAFWNLSFLNRSVDAARTSADAALK